MSGLSLDCDCELDLNLKFERDKDLSSLTTLGVGGRAEYYIEPDNIEIFKKIE